MNAIEISCELSDERRARIQLISAASEFSRMRILIPALFLSQNNFVERRMHTARADCLRHRRTKNSFLLGRFSAAFRSFFYIFFILTPFTGYAHRVRA